MRLVRERNLVDFPVADDNGNASHWSEILKNPCIVPSRKPCDIPSAHIRIILFLMLSLSNSQVRQMHRDGGGHLVISCRIVPHSLSMFLTDLGAIPWGITPLNMLLTTWEWKCRNRPVIVPFESATPLTSHRSSACVAAVESFQ